MTILSQSYVMLKKETGAEFTRKTLLENLRFNKENIKKTAREMACSKGAIYLCLQKERENNLSNKPHQPKRPHPKQTKEEIVNLIVKKKERNRFW